MRSLGVVVCDPSHQQFSDMSQIAEQGLVQKLIPRSPFCPHPYMTLSNALSDGGQGVVYIGLLNVIRLIALRVKLPIREIARRTGLSRNINKKYLNASTIKPKFLVPERPNKLDPYADKLAAWLKTKTSKSHKAALSSDTSAQISSPSNSAGPTTGLRPLRLRGAHSTGVA